MATTSGKAASVKVVKNPSFDFALLWMEEESSGNPALFVLWDYSIPAPQPTAFDRIAESMWLSMLREAIVHDLPVVIGHADDSSLVEEVTVARI